MISLDENKAYTLSIGSLDTCCIQYVSNMDTQVRIGKDRVRIDKDNIYNSPQIAGELNLSYKQVRTAIEHIVRAGTGAVKQYPKFLVITVLNYDAYQSDSQADQQSLDSQKSQKNEIVPNLSNENDNQNDSQKIGGKAYIKGDNNGYQNLKRQSIQQSNDSRLTVKSQADDNNQKKKKNEKNEKEYIALSGEPEFDVAKQEYAITEGRCDENVEHCDKSASHCDKPASHCDNKVQKCDTDIEIDIEIEKEIDKEKAPQAARAPARHKYGEYKNVLLLEFV